MTCAQIAFSLLTISACKKKKERKKKERKAIKRTVSWLQIPEILAG